MERQNQTMVSFFIIKGISEVPSIQSAIFFLVLLIYLFTLGGNITVICLVCVDHHLHTPMYFFLANLCIIDMCSTTVSLHTILLIGLTENSTISYLSCMAQIYFFGCFVSDELLFLTAMSYDRYVAICKPLRYKAIMNQRACALLASICWMLGFIEIIPYSVLVTEFSCYKSNIVNHFFCDLVPVIELSCSDTTILQTLFIVEGAAILAFGPFLLTVLSYIFIITTILRIRSIAGRQKAFYTCSSHLTVVILLYTTLIYQYLRPISLDSMAYNKLLSLFNTAAVPVLNPLIYSLKNKDVKSALKKRMDLFRHGY
ncbi:olfactory receptor 5V1-like [Hyperolius riggenbachi]|uniref:olfactory receptor 5V1-like n=1 Tax=Hyperolius riggenbachi TaxID=752182 RepID=UPI0035A3554C